MPQQGHGLRIIFYCQIAVGVLGNSLELFNNLTKSARHKQGPFGTILAQLALTNAVMLLSKGIPEAILYFRTVYFLGNYGCKLIFYIQRVSRGASLYTTCLLSAFQAVIISPNNSRLATLKAKMPKYVRLTCGLCCILTLLIDIYVPVYITAPRNDSNSHIRGVDLLYCYWENMLSHVALLSTLRDVLFVGCMVLASGYMVFLLCRHHQRTQQIHSSRLSPRTFPEIKATQTILLLVGTFFSTYCLSCGLMLYKVYYIRSGIWVVNVSLFITLCFPTISPFLLMYNKMNESSCVPCWRPGTHS